MRAQDRFDEQLHEKTRVLEVSLPFASFACFVTEIYI